MAKTLYIGLGGFGGRVVASIKKQADATLENKKNNLFVVLDSSRPDLEQFTKEDVPCISLRLSSSIRDCIDNYRHLHIEEWFPVSPFILHSRVDDIGLTRVFGRLAFLDAVESNKLYTIRTLLKDIFIEKESNEDIRVVIVTSLAGGTGSGIFIQMALWIRSLLQKSWGINGKIFGFFVGPNMFIESISDLQNDLHESDCLRANAYASLKELEMITGLKTGFFSSPAEKICLDDLFNSSNVCDRMPVYDQLYIYETNNIENKESISFDELIERIARSAFLMFSNKFSLDYFIFPWIIKPKELYLNALGTAIASYPRKKILEYCSLRAAQDLLQCKKDDISIVNENEKISQFIKEILGLIDDTIYEAQYFDNHSRVDFNITTNENIVQYVKDTLRLIENETEASFSQIPQMCDSLMCKIVPREYSNISCVEYSVYYLFSEMGDQGNVECLSPNTIRVRLETLKSALGEFLRNSEETHNVSFFEASPVPLTFGNRSIKPSRELEFPLLVWNKNKSYKALNRKKFYADYLEWFSEYCKWSIEQHRKQMAKKIIYCLFPMLANELDNLIKAMKDFDGKICEVFDRLYDNHMERHSRPDIIELCTTKELKERIYLRVSPYEKLLAINRSYVKAFLRRYCYANWPEYGDNYRVFNDESYFSICKEILQHIKESILNSSLEHIDFEVVEALLFQECENMKQGEQEVLCDNSKGVLEKFCSNLRNIASDNLLFAYDANVVEENASFRKTTSTLFGVSRECNYRSKIQDIAHEMGSVGVIDSNLDKSIAWCMRIVQGIKLAECPIMSSSKYYDAYKRICEEETHPFGDPLGPHIDKRWVELFNKA